MPVNWSDDKAGVPFSSNPHLGTFEVEVMLIFTPPLVCCGFGNLHHMPLFSIFKVATTVMTFGYISLFTDLTDIEHVFPGSIVIFLQSLLIVCSYFFSLFVFM